MTRRPIILDDDIKKDKRVKAHNKRLRVILSVITLLVLSVTSLYFYNIWQSENRAIEDRLQTFTELRKSTLSRFMNSLGKETALWANHESVVDEVSGYIDIWDKMDWPARSRLRQLYYQKRETINGEPEVADYVAWHEKHHQTRKRFLNHHGYYDVFYFNLDGDIVYSVTKEDDYALNYESGSGKFSDTGLGLVFRAARGLDKGAVVYDDFKPYAPSGMAPAAFLASPIFDNESRKIGVYAIQIPVNKLDDVMQYTSGLGETGETYAVGADFLMRNNSRLSEEKTLLVRRIETQPIKIALAGKSYIGKSKRKGKATLIATQPLEFLDYRIAIATEMELAELRKPLKPYLWFFLMAIGFVLTFGYVQYYLLRQKPTSKA